MAELGIEAARWVVGRALGTASTGLLGAWAASAELGTNFEALTMELLYAEGMLNNARGRGRGRGPEIENPALAALLQKLRDLAYRADDVLDELEYFRIQDELDGTYNAAEEHAGGCLRNHMLNARHAVSGVLGLSKSSGGSRASRDAPDEDTPSKGVFSCPAWSCPGLTAQDDDDEQEEKDARCLPCGAIWPCGRDSSNSKPKPPTQEVASGSGCMSKITSAASAKMSSCFSRCCCGSTDHNQAANEEKEDAIIPPCSTTSTAPPPPPPPPPPNQANQEESHHGCMGRLASTARGTIHSVGKHLPCSSVLHVQNAPNSTGPSNKAPEKEHVPEPPKLKFDRVGMSRKMKEIVDQLKPLCAKVSTILNLELLDSNRSIAQSISSSLDTWFTKGQWPTTSNKNAMVNRPVTTPQLSETKLYGRAEDKRGIISDIISGKYSEKDCLTVLPIVGPGGIGKTTLTRYIYKELEKPFKVKLWVCVSVNFNVYRLKQEIANQLKQGNEGNPDKTIEEELKSKKFLLVLDDMWNCSNVDEWNRFVAPFTKGQTKGNVILVTTRFPALAQMVKTTDHWKDLKGLEEEDFKKLFLACVFDDKKSQSEHSELLDTGYEILKKLKGSPLAAKTVGKLLRNHLDLGYWARVLESKEWESMSGDDDIMPALKLSFDYLPFYLQQCFTYCALFPEDYKFSKEVLVHFWIGQDVLDSRGENKSIEDIGQSCLTELVNHGFFKKEKDDYGCTYYIIHDLLHELALKVSADECLSICSSDYVGSLQIPLSIRHLSINIDESSVKDRKTFDMCKDDFRVFGERLKVENLRSLMLFGKHQGSFVNTFRSFFRKGKNLRLIFISEGNYRVDDLFHNDFLNLVHLRYLRIQNDRWEKPQPPKNISRFYHLRVLDLRGCKDCSSLSGHMKNLVKLRHFLVRDHESYPSISGVGNLKSLQALKKFNVRKENKGFELRQIGHLLELCGSLSIDNLENVEGREEADGAKLTHKKHLQELILNWNAKQSNGDSKCEEEVLEALRPHNNLLKLRIRGHGGRWCPSWLVGQDISVQNLESLCLDGVAWKTFPPIGELRLGNEGAEEILSNNNIPGKTLKNLKRIELINIKRLERWAMDRTSELLSHLEVLIIEDCPELTDLSFSDPNCSQTRFPSRLKELRISSCPNLSSFPPVPFASVGCSIEIKKVGLGFELLRCGINFLGSEDPFSLEIKGNDDAHDSPSFWTALDFDNLTDLKKLKMANCPALPLDGLQMLSAPLNTLSIEWNDADTFWPTEHGSYVRCKLPVLECLTIRSSDATGKELTKDLSFMPKLSELSISSCEKIKRLGVVEQQAEATSSSSSQCGQQRKSTEEVEEIAAEELLLLPPQLHTLTIGECPEMSLRPDPLHGENRGGLQALSSLRDLTIQGCPKFLALYVPPSASCFPFPGSLRSLWLERVEMLSPLSISNLTSLTSLVIIECAGLGVVGLGHLLTHGCLNSLSVLITPNFFSIGSEEPPPHPQMDSSKLQRLETDDVEGALGEPICRLLSSSLTELALFDNRGIQGFTKEQDEALQLLTSLQELELYYCEKLQCHPAGLHRLTNLKTLTIQGCPEIRTLSKGSLPDSLQKLRLSSCSAIRLPKDIILPRSLQVLDIRECPSIRALTKACLPSSLQVLRVEKEGNSEELIRQCSKLIGIIPIVELVD